MKFYLNGALYENVDTSQHPQAVEVTPEQAAAIEAGTHTFINGEFREIQPPLLSVEEYKTSVLKALDAQYSASADVERPPLSIEVKINDIPESFQLATGSDDVAKFQQDLLLQKSLLDLSEAQPTDTIVFSDATGAMQTIPLDAYVLLLSRYGKAIRTLWEQYKILRAAVEAAQTVEAINELVGGGSGDGS